MDLTTTFLLQSSILMKKIPPVCHQLRNKSLKGSKVDKRLACKWCFSSWMNGQFSLRVVPSQMNKLSRNLLGKLSVSDPHLKKIKCNRLAVKCLVCLKTTKNIMVKSVMDKIVPDAPLPKENIKFKKKKPKKDKSAGLNLSPMISKTVELSSKMPSETVAVTNVLKNLDQIDSPLLRALTKKVKGKKGKKKKKKKSASTVKSFIDDC